MLKKITQPRDSQYLKWNPAFAHTRQAQFEKAQQIIDSEVLRRDDPYMPKRTGALIRSGVINTRLGSGEVIYSTPYARRLYYNPQYNFNGAPQRGGQWFERMKIFHRGTILQMAAKVLR